MGDPWPPHRDLRLEAERPRIDGVDLWTCTGPHVGALTVAFSDSEAGQLAARTLARASVRVARDFRLTAFAAKEQTQEAVERIKARLKR